MLKLKDNVSLLGLRPETLLSMFIVYSVFNSFEKDCVITSVCDSVHSKKSLHYCGFAFDIRISNIGAKDTIKNIFLAIKELLTLEFDVVLEHDHIHVEFQPKLEGWRKK